ncbi:MAG: GNAT family N-acetyltransferase [Alphaproteobacteria bacterium]|nr:GNAT family N-acetyltransferase [Alphaproteobacteria bacterium]
MEFAEKLEAERIVLVRPIPSFSQAREIFAAVEESRANLEPWLPWCKKTTKAEDSFGYLKDWCEKGWNEKTGFAYLIKEKTTGTFLGCIDFMKVSETDKSGEIGYWIRKSAEGKGYMSEALAALEKEIFGQGINRIYIGNDTRNIRSANVAKRAGYRLEGILRQNRWDDYSQSFIDSNVWAKLKEEYK